MSRMNGKKTHTHTHIVHPTRGMIEVVYQVYRNKQLIMWRVSTCIQATLFQDQRERRRASPSIGPITPNDTPNPFSTKLLLEYFNNIIVLSVKLWVTFIRKKNSSRTVLHSPPTAIQNAVSGVLLQVYFLLVVLILLRAHFIPTVGVRKGGEY